MSTEENEIEQLKADREHLAVIVGLAFMGLDTMAPRQRRMACADLARAEIDKPETEAVLLRVSADIDLRRAAEAATAVTSRDRPTEEADRG